MNITDELRAWWVRKFPIMDAKLHKDFTAIADRIDAEHESACAEAYGNGVMSVPIALDESAWVELPKDADGEYIRIGDVMESKGSGLLFDKASFEVRAMRCGEDGWEVYDRLGDRYAPSLLRYHHTPTVEDVLREFTDAILEWSGKSGTVAEVGTWSDVAAKYAKRLMLAEGEDA